MAYISSFTAHSLKSFLSLIHDWGTFAVFIGLGFVQIALAVKSGNLAVESLPPTSQSMRPRHLRSFKIMGALLLVLTVAIGYLNDKNQGAAQRDVDKAQTQERFTQQKLDALIGQFGTTTGKLDLLVARLNKNSCPPNLERELAQILRDSVDAIREAQIAGPAPPIQSKPSEPIASPRVLPSLHQDKSLTQRIDEQIQDLTLLKGRYQQMEGSSYHAAYRAANNGRLVGPDTHPPTNIDYGAIFGPTLSAYGTNLSSINAIRTEAHLHMTASQISEDDRAFDKVNEALINSPSDPEGKKSSGFYLAKLNDIQSYLGSLKEKISNSPAPK